MALPSVPAPCPTLRPGLSLGAPEHQGFAATWNWIVGIFRNAAKYLVSSVNGTAGDLAVVGGNGIQVVTSGNTVTINAGDGEDENHNSGGRSGGGGYVSGGGSGGYVSGGYGGTSGGAYPAPLPTPSPGPVPGGGSSGSKDSGGGCNNWSDEGGNGDFNGSTSNDGDSCSELNGW